MNGPKIGFSGPLPPQDFNMAHYCLAASARAMPDKIGLIVVHSADGTDTEIWTYRALDDAVRRVAAGLLNTGLRQGDRLMIRLPNTSTYALLFFGALAAGIIPLPASTQLTNEEAEFLRSDCAAAAIALPDNLQMELGDTRRLTEQDIADLFTHGPGFYADTKADQPGYLVYTSGTSGKPKGVLHAHRAAWGRRPMYDGWYGINANDIVLHAGAFNWTYTLGVGLTDPWANGATAIVYTGEKDVNIWPQLIEQYRATLFAAVPSLYRQILKYCDLKVRDLSSLRHGLTAGEALLPALQDHWHAATGKHLYEALGMSECSTYISTGPSMEIRAGSPGKAQPGRSIAILPVDAGDAPLPTGETGMLAVHRSDPALMLNYWNRPEEDELVFRGDWFIGGDLARFDEDGYLWYEGRADDVMNAMGYRVSPQEVEAVLARHPDVQDVAVCELRITADISVIAAFIVLKAAGNGSATEVSTYAHEHLAAYKCPREIIFIDTLPRSAN
ncbi:MAG: class I adenylate-forming enzyme family protein, partial [Parvibaculum sp.]